MELTPIQIKIILQSITEENGDTAKLIAETMEEELVIDSKSNKETINKLLNKIYLVLKDNIYKLT